MRLKGVPKNHPLQQETTFCACGCGSQIDRYYLSDQHWHERCYVHNHHRNGSKQSEKQKQAARVAMQNLNTDHRKVSMEKRKHNQRWIDSTFGKKAIEARWANTRRVITYWFCAWCGKPFKKNWSAIKNPNLTFCCNDHKYNYFSGSNHFYYEGGPKRQYPREWNAKLRSQVKVRDGKMCVVCRTQNYRVLVVHHIDEDKTNCRLENLVTLCRSCHQKVHGGSVCLPSSAFEV